jgi:hypothetical protein
MSNGKSIGDNVRLDAKYRVQLKRSIRLVEIEGGALVVDETTLSAAEVNLSGWIILKECVNGADYDEVVAALADEAQCPREEAKGPVHEFLKAAEQEGWVSIADLAGTS